MIILNHKLTAYFEAQNCRHNVQNHTHQFSLAFNTFVYFYMVYKRVALLKEHSGINESIFIFSWILLLQLHRILKLWIQLISVNKPHRIFILQDVWRPMRNQAIDVSGNLSLRLLHFIQVFQRADKQLLRVVILLIMTFITLLKLKLLHFKR